MCHQNFPTEKCDFGEEGIKTRNVESGVPHGSCSSGGSWAPISSIGQSPQEDYISHDAPWCSPMLRRKSFSQPRF